MIFSGVLCNMTCVESNISECFGKTFDVDFASLCTMRLSFHQKMQAVSIAGIEDMAYHHNAKPTCSFPKRALCRCMRGKKVVRLTWASTVVVFVA